MGSAEFLSPQGDGNTSPEVTSGDVAFEPYAPGYRIPLYERVTDSVTRLLTAGSCIENPDDFSAWLKSMRDGSLWDAFAPRTLPYYMPHGLLARVGEIDMTLSGVSLATQLAQYYNEPFPGGAPSLAWTQFRHNLTKHAVELVGLNTVQLYRLLYHGDTFKEPTDPTARAAHNFLSQTDKVNRPPEMAELLAHLHTPIDRGATPIFVAMTRLLEDTEESHRPEASTRLIGASVDATLNLLTFIDAETKPATDTRLSPVASTNAGRMLTSIRRQRGKVAYAGLEGMRGVPTATPYTALLRLANQVYKGRQEANEAVLPLQEDTIEDLPRAIDRILDIAVNFGDSAHVIAQDDELREVIIAVHAAIDEVVGRATRAKLQQPVFTVADAVVALRTYLSPEEAAAAADRLLRREPLGSIDSAARFKRVGRVGRWYSDYLRRPGYGRLS